jgi:hypothetical protein
MCEAACAVERNTFTSRMEGGRGRRGKMEEIMSE